MCCVSITTEALIANYFYNKKEDFVRFSDLRELLNKVVSASPRYVSSDLSLVNFKKAAQIYPEIFLWKDDCIFKVNSPNKDYFNFGYPKDILEVLQQMTQK